MIPFIMVFSLWACTVQAAEYDVVTWDANHQSLSVQRGVTMDTVDPQAPIALDALTRSPLIMAIPNDTTHAWEMDVPLLLSDDTVVHLIGRATAQSVNDSFTEVNATVQSVQNTNCAAVISSLLRSKTIVAQKVSVQCLNQSLHVASALIEGSDA